MIEKNSPLSRSFLFGPRWLLPVLVVAAVALAGFIGFWVGVIIGSTRANHRLYLEEREVVEPVVQGHPRFAGVEISGRSDGGVSLIGEVPSRADLDRLRAEVAHAIGRHRTELAVSTVKVSEPRSR
jgi:hypothetical protein